MRLVLISDTHEQHDEIKIPDGDVLIHAGDATWIGAPKAVKKFNEWMTSLPHKHKIVIAGNHDLSIESRQCTFKYYLEDSGIEIDGIKFWGSPWTPTFGSWAFMEHRDKIGKYWDLIPHNIDVLITHGPPFGILDRTPRHQSVGCNKLFNKVVEIRPKIHVFGHIHHSYGTFKTATTTFINASNCNENYEALNPPIEIDL